MLRLAARRVNFFAGLLVLESLTRRSRRLADRIEYERSFFFLFPARHER